MQCIDEYFTGATEVPFNLTLGALISTKFGYKCHSDRRASDVFHDTCGRCGRSHISSSNAYLYSFHLLGNCRNLCVKSFIFLCCCCLSSCLTANARFRESSVGLKLSNCCCKLSNWDNRLSTSLLNSLFVKTLWLRGRMRNLD